MKRIVSVGVATVCVLLVSLFTISSAFGASTSVHSHVSMLSVHTSVSQSHTDGHNLRKLSEVVNGYTCSDTCDGQDPYADGCASDAYEANRSYNADGWVVIMYSPSCGTNWAVVYSAIGPQWLYTYVVRDDGLSEGYGWVYGTYSWGNMIFAPGSTPAYACGWINSQDNPACTNWV